MRILQVAPWVTFGGSDRGTIDWLRTLSQRGCETYLLTTQQSDNALFGEAERWAREAWCLPELMPGREMPEFILRFMGSRRIDAVQVMNSKLGFDLLPAIRARLPHVVTVAQLHAEEGKTGGYPPYVAGRFDRDVDAYSLVSHALAGRMAGYGADESKLSVIHLGVDTAFFDPEAAVPAFAPTPSSGLQILFPHRLAEQKDPQLMVEIAAALAEEGCAAVIHVVGDGEERPALEEAVRLRGLEDRVVFHGARLEMPGWYQATDVTLITSRFEGVPLVAYEAMAMARPVVSADVGAVAELVDPGSGFLIRPRDSVPTYVSVLRRLAGDLGFRRALGEHGRRRVVAGFSVDTMADRHHELYAGLPRSGGAGAGPAPAAGGPPPVSVVRGSTASDLRQARSRWMVLWWGEDTEPLSDPAFVEKAFHVAVHAPDPVVVGLCAGPGHHWRPASPPEPGVMVGALVERDLLATGLPAAPTGWRSFPVAPDGGTRQLPRHLGPGGPLARLRARARSRVAPPARPGVDAGSGTPWVPPDTVPVQLAWHGDDVILVVGDDVPSGFAARQVVGRAFTAPFLGTVPLVARRGGVVVGGEGAPAGYALTSGLPGMVELRLAVGEAVTRAGLAPPAPLVDGDPGPAWVDLAEPPPA